MLRAWTILPLAFVCFGCGRNAAQSPTQGGVVLSEREAPSGYLEVGALSVQSGKGCGLFGERGSMEEAEELLREAAAKRGATYVQLTRIEKPKFNHACVEHEYKLSGIAFRAPEPAQAESRAEPQRAESQRARPTPLTAAPVPATKPALPRVLLDYEGDAALGKPARATERSSLALTLAAGESGGSALSVAYRCSGGTPERLLELWYDLGDVDLQGANALSARVKAENALSLRVAFVNARGDRHVQETAPLSAGVWQSVELPLAAFSAEASTSGASASAAGPSRIRALGFSPTTCEDGQFLIDDVRLE